MAIQRAIIGLGNPGERYAATRHNAGCDVVDRIAQSVGARFKRSLTLQAWIAAVDDTIIVKPAVYMNISGVVVKKVMKRFLLTPDKILIVCDDLDTAPGIVRRRQKGSAGGHNGLKSIIEQIGSQEFARLKVGIGRPADPDDAAEYVLSRCTSDERELCDKACDAAASIGKKWLAGAALSE
jgi:peptidyl-tRNA hydrolase, PTH1 family